MSKPSRSPQALTLLRAVASDGQRWLSLREITGALKWVTFKETRETLWNFGYSHGDDTGQAISWGRSLANSPPNFFHVCPRQSQSQLSGEEAVSLCCTTSPSGILTINWVSEIMPTFVLIKATELKPKQRQLARQARMTPGQNAGSDLQLSAWCFGENVEGRRVHPAVNKYDQPGHSSLFTLLQETMFIKTHPSIYKKKQAKNKNTNFQEPVFELLSASIWGSAAARLPWNPRTTGVPGHRDRVLLQSRAHRGSPSPRTSAPLTGVYLEPMVTYLSPAQTEKGSFKP